MYFWISRICVAIVSLTTLLFLSYSASAAESDIIQNIIKIKTYTAESNGSFVFTSYGSAIAIGRSRILTNAHVILGKDDVPTGLYEVCFSTDFEKVPVCHDSARLIAYDSVADLAILEFSHTQSLTPFTFASSKIAIGSYVSMYGYPGIGGETITRTEGKIAGYEQTMYKIDWSIDHGNSGGGAFNNSWELLGIPTAVASDNASIGYMIPVKRIIEFLGKKTSNYEIFTGSRNPSFINFLKRNQSYTPNTAIYSWNDLVIKNPRRYGFMLKTSIISQDNTMVNWNFSDRYDRLHFTISCTDDAGGIPGWKARLDGLVSERELYPDWNIESTDENDFLTIYSSSKAYKPGVTLYYKKYDACYADIDYLDARKDHKSLQRAMDFLKKEITFKAPYLLKDTHSNPFFTLPHTGNDIRVIRSIDSLGTESILLGFTILSWQWISAVIEGKTYDSLSDLSTALGTDFGTVKTWNDYIALGIKSGIDAWKIVTVSLSPTQKGVLYSHYNTDKKNTTLAFAYSYITSEGRYAYWTWSAVVTGNQTTDMARLRHIFEWLIYPGQSFLKD